jgi:hypothetical protein
LTDGDLYARARCGNRISLVPQAPVAEAEPRTDVLDTPESAEAAPEAILRAALRFDPAKPGADGVFSGVPENTPSDLQVDADPLLEEWLLSGSFTNSAQFMASGSAPMIHFAARRSTTQLPTATMDFSGATGSRSGGGAGARILSVPEAVPEPSTWVLAGVVVGGLVLVTLRRRRGHS